MILEVLRYPNGRWKQNCYVAGAPDGDAIIVDPGSGADDIAALIDARGWRPIAILNTHAHYDHVGAVADLADRFSIPFWLHKADAALLQRANLYRLIFESRARIRIPVVDRALDDDDLRLEIGKMSIDVLCTPGHTEGSVCFKVGDCLFTGDTLLPGAVGRTDLPGGNAAALRQSLRKLVLLPGTLRVFPGHGGETSLRAELRDNEKLSEFRP